MGILCYCWHRFDTKMYMTMMEIHWNVNATFSFSQSSLSFSCSWKFNVSFNELLIFHHLHSCFPPLKTTSTALCMEHGKSESNNSSTQKKHQNSQVCCSFFLALVVFTRKFRLRRALFRRPALVRRGLKIFFSLFIYFPEKNVPSQHLPDIKVNVNRESNVKL